MFFKLCCSLSKSDKTTEQRGNYFISLYIVADYMCNDSKGNLQNEMLLLFLEEIKFYFKTGFQWKNYHFIQDLKRAIGQYKEKHQSFKCDQQECFKSVEKSTGSFILCLHLMFEETVS